MSQPTAPTHKHRTWIRDGFLISTDPSLIPIEALTQAFASPQLYWAKAIPEDAMRQMLANSLSFGLYSATSSLPPKDESSIPDASAPETASDIVHEIAMHVQPHPTPASTSANATRPALKQQASSAPELIGFARCITDHTTFLYLTDVYVLPAWQSQGLGKWLIQCVQSVVEEMPYLRRTMAITGGIDAPEGAGGMGDTLQFYKQLMKMGPVTKGRVITWKGPGNIF